MIQDGVLESYLLNCYRARKLGLKTTGNASRGLAGNPGVGAGNFMIEPGSATGDEIIGSVKSGLYVTELMGFGVNPVTGDLLAGRGRVLDRERQARLSGLGGHDCREPQADVSGH